MSNPIQQRIELMCDKWEDSKRNSDARIVRIQCQPDETDMVDNFYDYMIGMDTPVLDIAFHFESHCTDLKLFSTLLLQELEEAIYIWNNIEKEDSIDFVRVDWNADYSLLDEKNPATLFIRNFNNLSKTLNLKKDLFTVAILKNAVTDKNLIAWLKFANEAEIDSSVKFLFHDTTKAPTFNDFATTSNKLVETIYINLDMPKALEQCAAMGDPKDPATPYRQLFIKMINAMGADKEAEAEKWGGECIDIATKNISKDPYWIMQIVVVYIALGNDKIRYKKKKESLIYANQAVETANAAKEYLSGDIAEILRAQALMFRGNVFFINSNSNDAFGDYSASFNIYKKQGNIPLAIEASRMAGASAFKSSMKTEGIKILAEGTLLCKNIDAETAKASTFAGILEFLIKTEHSNFIPVEEVEEIANRIYGPDWRNEITQWKKLPDKESLIKQETEVANA